MKIGLSMHKIILSMYARYLFSLFCWVILANYVPAMQKGNRLFA